MRSTKEKRDVSGVIHVEIAKCVACHSCELACAVGHSESGDLLTALQRNETLVPRVQVRAVGDLSLPVQCRHCAAPACVEACPSGALEKPDPEGPVWLDDDVCAGHQLCIAACPFGAISVGPDGRKVVKCDLCADRVAAGLEPACVEACPTRALALTPLGEVRTYVIDTDACTGCTLCARNCPMGAIEGERRKPHVIRQEKCLQCGLCHQVCRFEAVLISDD